jgi:hypothetical protein
MNCYECAQKSSERAAVGLCHNCSAGLCGEHVFERPRDMTTTVPLGRIVTLPIAAREILCQVCKTALEQPRRVA